MGNKQMRNTEGKEVREKREERGERDSSYSITFNNLTIYFISKKRSAIGMLFGRDFPCL